MVDAGETVRVAPVAAGKAVIIVNTMMTIVMIMMVVINLSDGNRVPLEQRQSAVVCMEYT